MSGTTPQVFESERARASLERPATNVLLLTMSGSMSRDMAIEVAQALDLAYSSLDSCLLFGDLELLKDYDSRLRIDCTQVLRSHWAKVKGVSVLARSSLVLMGVSVANLALENRIKAHGTRPPWQRELDVALGRRASFPPRIDYR